MITMYEMSGCSGCRKAKAWLKRKGLEHTSKNMLISPPSKEELLSLFAMADDVFDLISRRSIPVRNFKETHGFPLEDLRLSQLIEFLQNNPTALRRPIITDGKFLVIGWDEEEMSVFDPDRKRYSAPL